MPPTPDVAPTKWTLERFARVLRDMNLNAKPLQAEGEVMGCGVDSEGWDAFFLEGRNGDRLDSVWLQAKVADTATLEAVGECNRNVRFVRAILLGGSAEVWMDFSLRGLDEAGVIPNIQMWQTALKQAHAHFGEAVVAAAPHAQVGSSSRESELVAEFSTGNKIGDARISILTTMLFADGELQEEERDWIDDVCNRHEWFRSVSRDEFLATVAEARLRLRSHPWRDLLTAWANAIPTGDREEMFGLALHLGMADDEPLGGEHAVLGHLQHCFRITPERVQAIFRQKAGDF